MTGAELREYYKPVFEQSGGCLAKIFSFQIPNYYERESSVPLMTPQAVLDFLRSHKIKDSTLWDWSNAGNLDCRKLKEFLERSGFPDTSSVLPPFSKCFSACKLIAWDFFSYYNTTHTKKIRLAKGRRMGLPGIAKFSLKLLYFVLFPDATDHFEHHEADIDALKCGKVTKKMLKHIKAA